MSEDSENSGVFKRLQGPLMNVELEVQAVVDVVDMNVGEIMKLRPGDIIQLNTPWPRTGGTLGRRETQVLWQRSAEEWQ